MKQGVEYLLDPCYPNDFYADEWAEDTGEKKQLFAKALVENARCPCNTCPARPVCNMHCTAFNEYVNTGR